MIKTLMVLCGAVLLSQAPVESALAAEPNADAIGP